MLHGISGRRGCGKTALARECTYWLARHGRFVVAFDPVHQWPDSYRRPFDELCNSDKLPMLVAVSDCEPDEIFDWALSSGNVTVAADEFDLVCSAHSWTSDSARHIVRRGRHYHVGLIATFQRAASINGDFIALASRLSFFQTTHTNDVERISKACGEEYARAVSGLTNFNWIDWPDGLRCRMGASGSKPFAHPLARGKLDLADNLVDRSLDEAVGCTSNDDSGNDDEEVLHNR